MYIKRCSVFCFGFALGAPGFPHLRILPVFLMHLLLASRDKAGARADIKWVPCSKSLPSADWWRCLAPGTEPQDRRGTPLFLLSVASWVTFRSGGPQTREEAWRVDGRCPVVPLDCIRTERCFSPGERCFFWRCRSEEQLHSTC